MQLRKEPLWSASGSHPCLPSMPLNEITIPGPTRAICNHKATQFSLAPFVSGTSTVRCALWQIQDGWWQCQGAEAISWAAKSDDWPDKEAQRKMGIKVVFQVYCGTTR